MIRDRYITLESSFLLDSVHSIAHDNLDYRKMCVWMLGGKEPWSLRAHRNGTHCCGFDTWHSCMESSFCSEMWLVAWNLKPKNICDVRTHVILSSKELKQCHHYEESWPLSPETIRCAAYGFAWLWRYCNLWVTVVHLRGYGRPFIAKGLVRQGIIILQNDSRTRISHWNCNLLQH